MRNFKSIKFYNQYAPFYKEYSNIRRKYHNSIDNLIVQHVNNKHSMIDIGSADGVRATRLAQKLKINELYFVDNNPVMHKLYLSRFKESYLVDISKERFVIDKKFDLLTSLGNVFGHMEDKESLITSLSNIKKLVNDNGDIFLDVHNRYNYKNYGILNVVKNIIKDLIRYRWENGNFNIKVKYENSEIKGEVHIFNPIEFILILRKVGIRISKIFFVDYNTGLISKNPFKGQMFLILHK